jgi:hypothetical protein
MANLILNGSTSGSVTLSSPAVSGTTTLTLPTTSGKVDAFPSGTKLLFQQTAAPTGWTKDVSHDNKALRVVSGTASSGGSVAFTTAFSSQAVSGTVGSTTLSTAQLATHNHNEILDGAGLSQGTIGIGGSEYCRSLYYRDAADGNGLRWATQSAGSGSSHNHSFSGTAINLAVQYVDVIIATKD